MDEVERYLAKVSLSIQGPEALRDHLRQELRTHLEQWIEDSVSSGLGREEATARAIESFGELENVREGLESVHGRRHLAFLIETAMDWREHTMKTTWKWSSVATMLLVPLIGLPMAVIWFIMIFLVPKMKDLADQLRLEGGVVHDAIWFGSSLTYNYVYVLLPLIVAWVLFELKVRSENKAMMRITGGITIAMIFGLVAAYMCGVSLVSLAILASTALRS